MARARTERAPRALTTSAMLQRVPPVKMMSSTITASRPATSPSRAVTSEYSSCVGRTLSPMATPGVHRPQAA